MFNMKSVVKLKILHVSDFDDNHEEEELKAEVFISSCGPLM